MSLNQWIQKLVEFREAGFDPANIIDIISVDKKGDIKLLKVNEEEKPTND